MDQHKADGVRGFLEGLRPYHDRRAIATFGLGMSSGFPLTFVLSLMGIWLSRAHVSRADVGLFALITTFYTWKFLWSPAIDRLPLGPITRRFGQRRGWLFVLQALMAAALLAISELDPATQLYSVAVLAALIAFLSASQDIVIDAYRIEIVGADDQGYSAASYVFGYRTANFIAGAGVVAFAYYYGWSAAIKLLPLLLLPGVVAALVIGEPERPDADVFLNEERRTHPMNPILMRLREAVVLPFKEFVRRDNWFLILLFIFLFKAGDAVTAVMTSPLIVNMGFSDLDIAVANKTVGFVALMVGVGLGAMLYKRAGVYPTLMFVGVLMMLTNLGFAWLAAGKNEGWRLAITIGLENFATGLGTTVVIAYMAGLCNANFTATQFALLSSLGNQARTLLGAPSGFVSEAVGWVDFFILATALALPGLIVLMILWKKDIRAGDLENVTEPADL
ncbi:AmpG family muropeptide MFS transporter [Kordiimonas marina]|uniref:AmpG family muropeptide MFS transporter n=1 Tax=Kordiimonas marina TaxID=2872312 RepID=UPI001FF52C41|nr:MFS transporter [Kordiimonas marina]MCJ9429793.1 MFS transporter [Kordiimonas marina]